MRILILSCNTGEGHNSAAKAVKECFEEHGAECEIKDALAFWSPEKSKIISKGHVFIYRKLPKLFGVGYRYEEKHPPKDGDESLMYKLVIEGCEKLAQHLSEHKYDAVICTHVFSAMMITELKKRGQFGLKSYFVATDYTCSPGVSQSSLDRYFIPHRNLADEFVENGINRDKIVASGIPVKKMFYVKNDALSAKHTLRLPNDKKIVLLMCGSMGCGPIKNISDLLCKKMDSDAMLTVICGNNKRLYKALTKTPPPENLRVVGYTNRMSLYMDAADIIITKPGGLSSTEASVKNVPLFFIDAVPGCETRNLEFFLRNGFAQICEGEEELTDAVCEQLNSPEKLKSISQLLKNEFSAVASEKIYHCVCEDLT